MFILSNNAVDDSRVHPDSSISTVWQGCSHSIISPHSQINRLFDAIAEMKIYDLANTNLVLVQRMLPSQPGCVIAVVRYSFNESQIRNRPLHVLVSVHAIALACVDVL